MSAEHKPHSEQAWVTIEHYEELLRERDGLVEQYGELEGKYAYVVEAHGHWKELAERFDREKHGLLEQYHAALTALERIAGDMHLVLDDHYSGRRQERAAAMDAYARLTVIFEHVEDEDETGNAIVRQPLDIISAALDPVYHGLHPRAAYPASEPLGLGETLHYEGCALPGDHTGSCVPASELSNQDLRSSDA